MLLTQVHLWPSSLVAMICPYSKGNLTLSRCRSRCSTSRRSFRTRTRSTTTLLLALTSSKRLTNRQQLRSLKVALRTQKDTVLTTLSTELRLRLHTEAQLVESLQSHRGGRTTSRPLTRPRLEQLQVLRASIERAVGRATKRAASTLKTVSLLKT